jgi:hypothetical protein
MFANLSQFDYGGIKKQHRLTWVYLLSTPKKMQPCLQLYRFSGGSFCVGMWPLQVPEVSSLEKKETEKEVFHYLLCSRDWAELLTMEHNGSSIDLGPEGHCVESHY